MGPTHDLPGHWTAWTFYCFTKRREERDLMLEPERPAAHSCCFEPLFGIVTMTFCRTDCEACSAPCLQLALSVWRGLVLRGKAHLREYCVRFGKDYSLCPQRCSPFSTIHSMVAVGVGTEFEEIICG
eukprot:1999193-Amphidinium_carterae.1